jgi:hypothetical protein
MTRQTRSHAATDPGTRCACQPLQLEDVRAHTVWHVARWYAAKGWIVRTRLPGWGRPPAVDGHVPDLYASNGEQEVAVDVVRPGGEPDAAELAHRAAFRRWQTVAPEHRRYSLESAHNSGVNRADAGFAVWAAGEGRNFW